jgi:hypothetical protein
MVVRFFLFYLIIGRACGLRPVTTVTIKQSRASEYHHYQSLKGRFIEDFDFVDSKARACFADVFKANMEIPEEQLKIECVGRYNEMVHYVYNKNMRRLKRAFFNLVVKNLEKFRVQYEDEIVYFLYLLNMITSKDLRIKESLISAVKTAKFQVHQRRFYSVIQILDELLTDFQTIQEKIIVQRTELMVYMQKQIGNRDKYLIELEERRKELGERNIDSHDIA